MSAREAFLMGVKDASPTYPAVLSFGLVAGVSTKAIGIANLQAILMSIFMFSGTAQLASLQLYSEGASLIIIYLTACLVNFRYIMYSATLVPYLKEMSFAWRALLSFLMVDQSFAFALNRFQDTPTMPNKGWYYLGISIPLFCIWSLTCIIGILLGARLPQSLSLDFTLPLVFLALTAVTLKSKSAVMAAFTGGITAALCASLPNGIGLVIAAIFGVTAGMISETWFKRHE